MSSILALPVIALVIFVCLKLFLSFGTMMLHAIGQFLLAINIIVTSIVVGLAAAGLSKELLKTNWYIGIGIVSFLVALGFLGYMISNVAHPIISYIISAGFGILDGYYLGGFLVSEVFPKYIAVDAFQIVATYIGSIVLVVSLFLSAKRAMPPTGLDELDNQCVAGEDKI